MQNITKQNAIQYCLTCLVKLSEEISPLQHYDNADISEDEIQEFKVISINIQTNEELQSILRRYIDVANWQEELALGHSICLKCYNKFQGFEKFRLEAVRSVEHLLTICNGKDVKECTAQEQLHGSSNELNEDMYKMLLKDTLMETESVLIESSDVERVDVQTPDPFGGPPTPSGVSAALPDVLHLNSQSHYDPSDTVKYNAYDWLDNESSNSFESKAAETDAKLDLVAAFNDNDMELKDSRPNEKPKEDLLTPVKVKSVRKARKDKNHQSKGAKNAFKCDLCNHSFAHKITLDAHVRKIHEGSKKPFQCDRCDKAYTFIGGLYTHIKEVHEVVVRSHSCDHPGCERVYTSFVAMQKHKRLKHSAIIEQKKYVCEKCGATFNQSGNLKHHRRTKHPTEEEQAEKEKEKLLYNCDICQKQFHSRYTLKYHTLQLHTDDMKYECSVCGRRMAKKFMLVQHMLVHSTDKMPCEHCGKQFIRKFELEAHIRAVHMKLKPFECQYCSECFASRKTLRHHEYIHTGEKPYVCVICGQGFRQQTCLKNHRKQHDTTSTSAEMAHP